MDTRPWEILVAEDCAGDVRLVRMALEEQHLNHILHVARDVAEAIAFIDRADDSAKGPRLDILVLDMHLPKCDGEAVLRRLRSTERYAQTPAVVMTSSDAKEDYDRAQKNAALFYFRKPSHLKDFMHLGAVVRDILNNEKQRAIASDRLATGGDTA